MQYRHFPAPRLWRLLCLAAAACGLAACGNLNSIHRTLDTASGTGALIDAKQRAIIVSQRSDVVTVNRMVEQAKGQPPKLEKVDEIQRRYIVCAEPSPDAMSAYAAEFSAELAKSSADGGNRSAAIKGALQEAAAFIGMRTPSIQLLRDAMYRTCEAYANGSIDKGQYELTMRRYQRYTVAMMAIEQLTQAGRVPSITLATEGGVNGERPLSEWTDEIKRQQGLQAKQDAAASQADADQKAAEAALEKTPQDAAAQKAKTTAQAAKTAAQAERARIETIIAALKNGMAGGTALSSRSAAAVVQAAIEGAARQVSDVQDTVKALALKVLETDDTGALCFEYLKEGKAEAPLTSMCQAYMDAMREVYRALADQCADAAASKDARAKCLEAGAALSSPMLGIKVAPPARIPEK